jgi:hypothetical protein
VRITRLWPSSVEKAFQRSNRSRRSGPSGGRAAELGKRRREFPPKVGIVAFEASAPVGEAVRSRQLSRIGKHAFVVPKRRKGSRALTRDLAREGAHLTERIGIAVARPRQSIAEFGHEVVESSRSGRYELDVSEHSAELIRTSAQQCAVPVREGKIASLAIEKIGRPSARK